MVGHQSPPRFAIVLAARRRPLVWSGHYDAIRRAAVARPGVVLMELGLLKARNPRRPEQVHVQLKLRNPNERRLSRDFAEVDTVVSPQTAMRVCGRRSAAHILRVSGKSTSATFRYLAAMASRAWATDRRRCATVPEFHASSSLAILRDAVR